MGSPARFPIVPEVYHAPPSRTSAPYARAVAGVVRAESRDPVAGVYRLSYDARGYVTELSLPPSAAGWRVTVSGGVRLGERVYARPGARVTVSVNRG
ncbi:hypothetical protein [Streptomyces sp. NPDC001970]